MKYRKSSSNISSTYIEFLGMPAAGKSTLLFDLEKKETGSIINVNKSFTQKKPLERKFIKFKSISSFVINNPTESLKDFKIITFSGQRSVKDYLVVLSNWFFILSSYRECNNVIEKKCIWDQGLFQALWSISFSSTKTYSLNSLISNKDLPSKVYFIDEIDTVLLERSKRRNDNTRLDYEDKTAVKKGREEMKGILTLLTDMGYERKENVYYLPCEKKNS